MGRLAAQFAKVGLTGWCRSAVVHRSVVRHFSANPTSFDGGRRSFFRGHNRGAHEAANPLRFLMDFVRQKASK
jgi:hypothetical protein